MVSCYYNPISANFHARKFWCKMIRGHCLTIISTSNYIAQSNINRTRLQNDRDHFQIHMTQLQGRDDGIYRCGIGNNNNRFYYTVNVTVSEGNKIPYSSEVIIANFKSSITINCPVPQEQDTGWRYWCKMSNMDVPSCHTLVNSSGYVDKNFWGRVLIQEVSNTSHFKILVNNIKINDFGFYRCGTGRFEDGSSWTDIHIHVLSPSFKMRYRISNPLTRSPGELVVAQCQVPASLYNVSLVYWCRWNETGCLQLIDSNGLTQEGFQNRISMNNTKKSYTMILSQLQLGDTGYYWCVITDGQNMDTSMVEVHVIAPSTTEAHLSPVSRETLSDALTRTAAYSADIPSTTGMDHSENFTPRNSYQHPETGENYGITHGYKLNTEVAILLGNSTEETPESKPGQDGGSNQSQASNLKNLILILVPLLAISCVIGFAVIMSVVIKVHKNKATVDSVHHQENASMIDGEAAKGENAEENEMAVELTKCNGFYKETEV
ncbi:high affinity immunoglobulin alpha and immunoglobulin mu Fc receptor isoform X1 [Dendropsophus ebraccatus]|uniref:high affinity immunoglobulin alpha and immunoglobulin mu Fc receptor isoform X1 n=1 Tax=Dendropsophus ebraccatus TaxID=150705 RepID=UPI0038319B7D